jgi:hypothetical protein
MDCLARAVPTSGGPSSDSKDTSASCLSILEGIRRVHRVPKVFGQVLHDSIWNTHAVAFLRILGKGWQESASKGCGGLSGKVLVMRLCYQHRMESLSDVLQSWSAFDDDDDEALSCLSSHGGLLCLARIYPAFTFKSCFQIRACPFVQYASQPEDETKEAPLTYFKTCGRHECRSVNFPGPWTAKPIENYKLALFMSCSFLD